MLKKQKMQTEIFVNKIEPPYGLGKIVKFRLKIAHTEMMASDVQ